MNRLIVDASPEVWKLVEPRLLRGPVVVVAPVLDQRSQVVGRDPVLPTRTVDLIGQARVREAAPEIIEDGVVDGNTERLDRLAHRVVR